LITLREVAEIFRVSRHTVQAWISPSSPNHRPEFAVMARHAGRRTLFVESEVLAWLDQRRGAIYSDNPAARTTFWRERFIAGRGLLRGVIKAPEHREVDGGAVFVSGLLAFDAGPLLTWLADGDGSAGLLALADRAEGLVLSLPLALWLLRKAGKMPGRLAVMRDFLLAQNIFELAPLTEAAVQRALELPVATADISLQSYCCCLEAGAALFVTADRVLLKTPGLPVCTY
jgi:predicted DNA-binding transcriptional regulator AlpA